ncbi:MAG: hypothetical protein IH947_13350 [Bacteroidetes bacterium]|nr:hypothetical protein [Bacteroidota bacterium]
MNTKLTKQQQLPFEKNSNQLKLSEVEPQTEIRDPKSSEETTEAHVEDDKDEGVDLLEAKSNKESKEGDREDSSESGEEEKKT